MCMNDFLQAPFNWAGEQALSESEAFETALERIKPEDTIKSLTEENAELRRQLREQSLTIQRLREAIIRNQEEWHD